MNKMVSVIVPVYNVESYLPTCIDSILNQTYTDLELILVDDGSTDKSGQVCDEYALRDTRIKVFHIPNGGPSVARNKGLEHAIGEFISFVDSDDRMHPLMLEDMIRSLDEHPECQLSICQFKFEDSYLPFDDVSYRIDRIEKGESLIDAMFTLENTDDNPQRTAITSLINKLYRRDAIEGIFFSGRRWFEDYEYNIQVFNRISQAVVLEGKYFYHLVRSASLAHLPQSSQGLQGVEGLQFCYNHIPANLQQARAKCLDRLFYKLLYSYAETRNDKSSPFTYRLLLKNLVTNLIDYCRFEDKFEMKCKTVFYMLFPRFFCVHIASSKKK